MGSVPIDLEMKSAFLKIILSLSFILLAKVIFAAEQDDRKFTDFINNATDGSSFEQAVALKDICDYKHCINRACLEKVFDETVFAQELQYVSDNFGERGKDWDVIGNDEVDVYTFAQDIYYDDLGLQVFAAGEKKVLHFNITSSVHELERKKFLFKK